MHRRIDAMPDGPRRDEYRARLAEIEKRINNPEQRLYVDGFAKFTPEMRAYYDKMINRLEDCGTRNFPKKGSKSVYGKGVVSFTLDEAGIASHLEIVKPSRNPSADAHIFRVIRSTSPFGPIPKRPTSDSDHDYDKLVMMSRAKDEMRSEYRREELGRGVRGKYFARASRGTNLVALDDKVAKAFPNSEAVNEALLGLLNLTEQTSRITRRSSGRAKARR
jgi:hypothetical protein